MNFTKILSEVAKAEKIGFIFNGNPITPEEVFADTGFLPAIARRADRLCLLCLGYGIGISFVDADKSRLGVRIKFDEVTPNMMRLMYLYDAIMELASGSSGKERVSVDELMYD